MTVGALIPVAKFNEYARDPSQRITSGEGLLLLDGTVILRSATGPGARNTPLGQRTTAGETIAGLAATLTNGDFTTKGLSGQDLAGTFSRSRRYPFIAASAQSTNLYLDPWRQRSYTKVLALLVAFTAMGWGARILFKANTALATSELLYRRLFDDVDEMIAVFHPDGRVVSLNASALAQLNIKHVEEVVGHDFVSLWRPEDGAAAAKARQARAIQGETVHFEVSLYLVGSDRYIDCRVSQAAFMLDGQMLLMAVARDITQDKRHLRQQEFLANHDPLTGLPNRHSLLRVLDCQIEDQAKMPIYLIFVNLARFREINESFGPRAGDTVLELSAQRLSKALASHGWTLTSLGGADFVAYTMNAQKEEFESIRQLVFQVLQEPVLIEGVELKLHARLGFANYPDDALDASQLLRCAELATTQAKASVNYWAAYDRELDKKPGHDLKIRTDLANAIRDDQLCLYYQPKVWLKDRSAAGAEALLRWHHPTLGWISPVEFIPLAESTELIHALTRWVLGKALDQIQIWQRAGNPVKVAINISTNNLQDPDFNGHVIDLLRRKEVDPALLDLEVTEGALAINPEIVLRRLEELRDMGVGLALDDFGTGFSSLSYVSQFPFTSIKIDRSFVSSLISSAKDRQVALVAISLGQNLHLKTIAEGVEDEATVQELLELECDIGQGYLFGRAMPLDEFNQWMASKAMSAALADS
jgi:diguanylate cyclase (GGDEF)-like protein/PAS domain S-box-containing protein